MGRQGRSEGRIPGPFGGRIPGPFGGQIPGPFGIIGYPPGMAFMSIHTMEGDPDDLLARKWTEPGGPGPPEPTRSAVLVPVPEAERVVSRYRAGQLADRRSASALGDALVRPRKR